MKATIAIAVVFLFAAHPEGLAAVPIGATDAKAYQDQIVDAQLESAKLAAQNGNFELVIVGLSQSLDPSVYTLLSPKRQHEILGLFGYASMRVGNWPTAHQAFKIATEGSAASEDDWKFRLLSARMANDSADAFFAFKHLRAQSLDFISDFSLHEVEDLDEQFSSLSDGGTARFAFGEALEQADWEPSDPFEDATPFWLPYATSLIEKGEIDKAARAAKRITDPMSIIIMRADKRFDLIIASDQGHYDPVKAGEKWLVAMQQAAAQNPDLLEGQVAVARALSILGKNKEALQVLDGALLDLGRGLSNRQRRFSDISSESGNALVRKAEILLVLGKVDEGLATLKTVLTIPWEKGLMTDLVVASRLNVFGRPEEALSYLNGPGDGDLSFRRPIFLAEIRACTFAQLNRTKELHAELEYLRAHRGERPDELELAEVCANDLDGAAAIIIAMLRDPKERALALSYLQVFSDDGLAPYSRILRSRFNSIRMRPDVQAALAPVGRSLTYDLRRY